MSTLAKELEEMVWAFPTGDARRNSIRSLAARVASLEADYEAIKNPVISPWDRTVSLRIPTKGVLSLVFEWTALVRKAVQVEREACAALAKSIGDTWRDLGNDKTNVTPIEGFAAHLACEEVSVSILQRKG